MAKKISAKTLWDGIITQATEKKEFQETVIENRLKPLKPIKYDDGTLCLETANNFAPQIINARYKQKLCKIAKSIDENFVDMYFSVAGEKDNDFREKKQDLPQAPSVDTPKTDKKAFLSHPVNKHYTFDNFISAYENRLAAGSAAGIANAPGQMRQYNPFYIYGKAGVGKTHILHAIANEITKTIPQSQVILVSGAQFYRIFSAHLGKDTYNDFENAFNKAKVVLFDNIHELSSKKEAQLELYKIFNKFHRENKQIVITANCAPSELSGITERLISRFQWGLSVKLGVENIETRRAILENMLKKNKIKISEDEIEYIVENCSENIHELQGIVANIAASVSHSGETTTSNAVRKVLKNRRLEPVKGYHSAKTILAAVCSYYKIDLETLAGKSRVAQISWARHVAVYLLKNYTSLSLAQIGNELGGKSHATVLHSVKEVESKMSDKSVAVEVKEIIGILARN
ncbi:MAG: chromosomal replication initiator protein DnaA [Chitinivibrionia bacterium]|nr:chromosomal replication initiator protein DnaA [Chitinivibrionia bacterium]